ncbi:signal recognition particle-docking protein FtsY [Tateyamaria sp. SN6-1]|uniref:signal recognition particle-docking protein FtsY n=1 Tax=Tateyamaria sp. SN6-1 TaxID=3092148 RepID=UPI0039F56868
MAFFKKLKNRLFKSSSKIDEGLEAIVEDGGVEEAATPDTAPPVPEPQPDPVPAPAPAPEPDPEPTPAAPIEPDPTPAPVPDPDPVPAPPVEPDPTPAPPADPEPAPAEEPAPAPVEMPPLAPEPAPMDVPREVPAPEPLTPPTPPEMPGPDGPQTRADPLRTRVDGPATIDFATDDTDADATPEAASTPGLLGRLLGRKDTAPVVRRTLDDDMLEQLEELLIAADMGVDTALRVTANMAEGRMGKKLSVQEIKELMAQEIARIMDPVAKPLPLYPQKPQVVLVVGVNGSGKTTTIGKLASQFRAAGKSVVIAAGDTFRAAAVEQLQVWGERAGVPVLTAPEGSDPASLAYDALTQAQNDGADLLMIDTAGRLQNRGDLMEELAKIVRVIRKKDESAPHNTLLVLDATTGQNAVEQVKVFQQVSDVSGLVMTKLDGTAKGGVLVALADKFGLPIHAIGVGEQIDDLSPFDPEEFAAALTGLDAE